MYEEVVYVETDAEQVVETCIADNTAIEQQHVQQLSPENEQVRFDKRQVKRTDSKNAVVSLDEQFTCVYHPARDAQNFISSCGQIDPAQKNIVSYKGTIPLMFANDSFSRTVQE